MQKPLLALILSSCFATLSASVPYYQEPVPVNFYVDGGFRQDNLSFAIGGKHRNPETHSKAKFRKLKIAQIGGSFDYTTHNHYYLRISGDYGRVLKGTGKVRNYAIEKDNPDTEDFLSPFSFSSSGASSPGSDSSFISSDSLIPVPQSFSDFIESSTSCSSSSSSFSSSSSSFESCPSKFAYSIQEADSNNGYVSDVLGAIGWKVISDDGRGWLAGIGGWSFHRQSFEMTNFDQEFVLFDLDNLGAISGLKGTYLANWTGPWLGVDFLNKIEYDVTVHGSVEWHFAEFRGTGHWNLDDDYKAHIRHNARGYGAVGRLGFDWTPCQAWALGVSGNYQMWSTRNKGRNRASIVNDLPQDDLVRYTFPVVKKSSLRRVRWNSYSVSGSIAYRF